VTPEQLITIVGQGGTAIILLYLLDRVMKRLDVVTDKLIEIIKNQDSIQQDLRIQAIAQGMEAQKRSNAP